MWIFCFFFGFMRTPMRACNFRHVFHVFSAVFGHTDLRKAVSKAKFDAESDFEVRLAVAPPKSIQNDQKLISEPEQNFFSSKNRKLQMFRNARCRSFAAIGREFEG